MARRVAVGSLLCCMLFVPTNLVAESYSQYQVLESFALPVGTSVYDALPDGRLVALVGTELRLETMPGSREFVLANVLADVIDIAPWGAAFLHVSPDGQRFAVGDNYPDSVWIFETADLGGGGELQATPFAADHFEAAWFDSHTILLSATGVISALDVDGGQNVTVISGVDGSSSGVTVDEAGVLYTGNGFDFRAGGSETGHIRAFEFSSWGAALSGGPAVDFLDAGVLVADILSAGSLGFDTEGNLYVGGGDLFGDNPDFGYAAVVRVAALSAALSGGGPVNPAYPGEVRTFDPDDQTPDNYYIVTFNPARGELYVREFGAELVYVVRVPSPFALEVTSYTGPGGSFGDPAAALGRPTVDTDYSGDAVPTVPVYAPWQESELVSLPEGELVVRFDHPIVDEPDNPFGVDLIVFGNSFHFVGGGGDWDPLADPDTQSVAGTFFAEPALVSVSQDGLSWYTYSAGPYADDFAATLGRRYDPDDPDSTLGPWNQWWSAPTDPTVPFDPEPGPLDFAGMSLAQVAQAYGESAGGTGFDLTESGLEWILYVRVENGGVGAPEIDAFADAAPDCNGNGVSDINDIDRGTSSDDNGNAIPDDCECAAADINCDGVVGVLDLLALLAGWGPCGACPEDIDGDGTVDVVDLLALLAAWG